MQLGTLDPQAVPGNTPEGCPPPLPRAGGSPSALSGAPTAPRVAI